MFIKRQIAKQIQRLSSTFPVIMVTGPRQAGKTTLLRQMDEHRRFVTLDDMEIRSLPKETPPLFFERFATPLLIDEFQYAPGILPYIKIAVDEKRTRLKKSHGEFWLTGSQNFAMMDGVTESLAGRTAILKLAGLSLREQLDKNTETRPFFDNPPHAFETEKKPSDLFCVILRGDKPELTAHPEISASDYYTSYIQTYLERDVRSQLGVRELGQFEKLIRLLAIRCGQLLNMSNLAGEIGVKSPTIKSWLTILERSFQIIILQPYYKNLNKRQMKTPKIYFLDSGLAAHLLKCENPEQTLNGPLSGMLFENWVVSEVIKSYWNNGEEPDLYFWRTRDGDEIDLVLEKGGHLHAAEIKLSRPANTRLFQTTEKQIGKTKIASKKIISLSQRSLPIDSDTELVSAWDI